MKYAKVKIKKTRTNQDGLIRTDFEYPTRYNKDEVDPVCYESKGKSVEFCVAKVADDYVFSEDIVEVSKQGAETLIEKFITENTDIKDDKLPEGVTRADSISKRKLHL